MSWTTILLYRHNIRNDSPMNIAVDVLTYDNSDCNRELHLNCGMMEEAQ